MRTKVVFHKGKSISYFPIRQVRLGGSLLVSRPDVQAFVGSLLGQKARQGVFITTSSFTQEASDYASGLSDQRVILIDGEVLAQYMIDHDVGVREQESLVIKRLNRDYFEDV